MAPGLGPSRPSDRILTVVAYAGVETPASLSERLILYAISIDGMGRAFSP